MKGKNIEELIIKFVEGKATLEEQVELRNLLEVEENRIYFEEYVELHYLLNSKINFDYKKPLKEITNKIQLPTKELYTHNLFKYAAAIIILITVGYFTIKAPNVKINEPIVAGTDKAILTLEDGTIVALEKGEKYKSKMINSDGEKIIYKSDSDTSSKEIVYNYLTVPRGGQFFIELEDGTKVWLNSESKLKYPVNFYDNQTRKVELVYGEAYFDVSSSADHNGASFIVESKMQNVEVLGTEFNVKAYKDEFNVYTTLVEGKVIINRKEQNIILNPTEQASLNTITHNISINVVDVYNEVSWKEGVFSFEGKKLKDLMLVLSRWYDMNVKFKNKELENVMFLGKLKKNQSIEEILKAIKNASIINSFEIIGDKTILLK